MVEVESNWRKITRSAHTNRRSTRRSTHWMHMWKPPSRSVQMKRNETTHVQITDIYRDMKYEQNYSAKLYCLVPSSTSAPGKDHVDQPWKCPQTYASRSRNKKKVISYRSAKAVRHVAKLFEKNIYSPLLFFFFFFSSPSSSRLRFLPSSLSAFLASFLAFLTSFLLMDDGLPFLSKVISPRSSLRW
jgi:hypothetical protein